MCRPDVAFHLIDGHRQRLSNHNNNEHDNIKKNDAESFLQGVYRLATEGTFRQKSTRATIGGLRIFNFHGILGMSSLLLSTGALISPTTKWIVLLSVLTSTTLSIHSSFVLVDQAPLQTTICRKPTLVVAPHREAFQRTSIVMLYTNARIIGKLVDLQSLRAQQISWLFITICGLRMLPTKNLDWKNGNTYCFVIPMMLSIVVDYMIMNSCDFYYEYTITTPTTTIMLHWQSWLELRQLIFVQLSGLVIAFFFTLAFRKHINIQFLYFASSIAVNFMFLTGIYFAFHNVFIV